MHPVKELSLLLEIRCNRFTVDIKFGESKSY